jgi:hypothetical protein
MLTEGLANPRRPPAGFEVADDLARVGEGGFTIF